ncbi:MAG: 4-(cytidine 5'-diphospho)-2-C-methyl-D-erythritol kinase, partial [Sneathiella sp.]|nr:4-(cytidine 5'-diphospho)-2-C-methyl-D-erythritol kinase [Sneathiella sp.]
MTLNWYARPKVNLFLHVTGKRADGYHLLESLVCFPEGGDVLTITSSSNLELQESGPYSDKMGKASDNLVLRAAKLLQKELGISKGADLHLEKNLPVASGIGGGSADAAAALHLLCDHWDIDVPLSDLMKLGEELGADVPVCLESKPALMTGVGEQVSPVAALPPLYILLVNPGVPVATPKVFAKLKIVPEKTEIPDFSGSSIEDFIARLGRCRNDLQAGAMEIAPAIGETLSILEQCADVLLSRMSGSDATCFGLFETE